MSLARAEVERVSLLGRLELTEAELTVLAELDTDDVEPMAHAVELSNVFRPDELRASYSRLEMLARAPHADGEFYLVPAVLGE
jgi:aspartyl-tRNA(Asn)/glutamyl-tRNA(Gln) amidotransferase subunit C